ncbi:MAG: hypothetical protein J6Y77_01790 [Paludibacteraceae bacterium]|nr:hypothetical protein [Paludibacteraceae bacterium]
MKTFFCAVFVWCFTLSAFAFGNTENLSPAAMARGGSDLACPAGLFSQTSDLSLFASDSLSVGLAAANQYGVKELLRYYASGYCLTSLGLFRLNLSHFGYDIYHETACTVGYGHTVGRHLGLGANLQALFVRFGEQLKVVPVADFSFSARPFKKLSVACAVQNISFSAVRVPNRVCPLPVCLGLGLRLDASKQVHLSLAVEKQLQAPVLVCGGVQWDLHPVRLYLGIRALERVSPCLGVGYRHHRWGFDVACAYDLRLGLQSSIGIYTCWR